MEHGLRVLLIRSGGLGDSILTLPVAAGLRKMYPEAELHLLGNENMLAVARLTGLFDGIRSLDEAGFSTLYAGSGTTPFSRTFFSRFDRVYCFTAGNAARIARTILESGARASRMLDPRPPQGWKRHITEYFLSILGAEDVGPTVLPRPSAVSELSRDKNTLVIHPGGGNVLKTWPLERFFMVAEQRPGETVFLLGPAELERGYVGRMPENCRILPDPPLAEAAALLSSASAYLGNDSGASHLAAMCGTPTVALFGPTDPRIWRPLGERVTVIASPGGSMEGISIEEVSRAIEYNLNRKGGRPGLCYAAKGPPGNVTSHVKMPEP